MPFSRDPRMRVRAQEVICDSGTLGSASLAWGSRVVSINFDVSLSVTSESFEANRSGHGASVSGEEQRGGPWRRGGRRRHATVRCCK